ncbi:MAG: MAPEG family protein [Hyphomicrobiaceae bacterium]
MPITALYAGLLTLLFILLSIRVIRQRRTAQVAIGHGEDATLLRRMRVHANFAEYVPLALILMALLESMKASVYLLHGLGLALLAGRCIHAFGVSQSRENISLRIIGMTLTFAVLGVAALNCVLMSALGRLSFAP